MASSHLGRQLFNLSQISLHFTPAIPERIIRARVKCTLETAHTMFQVHHEELLLDYGRRIVEGKQVREGVGIIRRFGEHPSLYSPATRRIASAIR
jgi:hypothetical protein